MEKILHIGLGKCASSSLQVIWDQSSNYKMHSVTNLTNIVSNILAENSDDLDLALHKIKGIEIGPLEFDDNNVNVLTSEGITFSYISDFKHGKLTYLKQKSLAALLDGVCTKVLLLVRDPKEWILSAYSQHIKEGGSLDFGDYLVRARHSLLNNLDLKYIKQIFEEHGFEITILPIELIKRSEEKFWLNYEDKLNIPKPDPCYFPEDRRLANVTDFATMPTHLKLNKIFNELFIPLQKGRPRAGTKAAQIYESLQTSKKWGSRVALHELDSQKLSELNSLIESDDNQKDITNNPITAIQIKLDKIFNELLSLVQHNHSYTGNKATIILKSIETSRKWVSRYALRESSSDKVFRLKELIELQNNDIFEKFSLDEQFLNQLRNNFLSPLSKEKDFPYKDILSEYTLSIVSLE